MFERPPWSKIKSEKKKKLKLKIKLLTKKKKTNRNFKKLFYLTKKKYFVSEKQCEQWTLSPKKNVHPVNEHFRRISSSELCSKFQSKNIILMFVNNITNKNDHTPPYLVFKVVWNVIQVKKIFIQLPQINKRFTETKLELCVNVP